MENLEELTLSDGQTQDLPEIPNVECNQPQAGADGCPISSSMMTNENSNLYTQGEFEACFNEFLIFLKSPDVSLDTFEALRAQGQSLAAGKIYNMAQKYKFLRFIIDRKTRIMHDLALIGIFTACEANAIVMNWTGISMAEKAKIWLKGKIRQRQLAAQTSGKRSVWGFLGRRGAEKQPKPEHLSGI